jgi:sporulation-control protein
MSRLLAELGIGVATVDLIVAAHGVTPGQTVDARLEIEGGSRDQEIEDIGFGLATEVEYRGDADLVEFGRETLTDPRTIPANATETIETTVSVPIGTPVTTVGETPVWLTAGFEIDWAPDPSERESLTVKLPRHLETVLDVLEGESMVCLDATCRSASSLNVDTRYAFVQVFDFQPRGGLYDRDIGSIEIVPTYSQENPRKMALTVVRDTQSGRLAVDHLKSPAVEWTRIDMTPETDDATVRNQLLDALDRLVP